VFSAIATDDEGNPTTDSDDASIRVHPPINVFIEKSPDPDIVFSGEQTEVTFTLGFRHNLPFTIYLVSITDTDFGNLLGQGQNLESNGCQATDPGFALQPNTTYTCQFSAIIDGDAGTQHENTVTIRATDVQSAATTQPSRVRSAEVYGNSDIDVSPPAASSPQFAEWKATAVVPIAAIGGQGGGGGAGDQPPTDMLAPSDALSAVTEGGNPLDDTTSWALWVLVTAMLIVSGAWVIRRQRFAEI
jgi:hypothetical protein